MRDFTGIQSWGIKDAEGENLDGFLRTNSKTYVLKSGSRGGTGEDVYGKKKKFGREDGKS